MKKYLRTLMLLLGCSLTTSIVRAEYSEPARQAIQKVLEDVEKSLKKADLSGEKTITLLAPLAGDEGNYTYRLLKNTIQRAGLSYVEPTDNKIWEEAAGRVETSIRKGDLLDPDTIMEFGKLLLSDHLMYGSVEVSENAERVYVEITLHVNDLQTTKLVWGETFSKRHYNPGKVQGIIELDADIRKAMGQAFKKLKPSLSSAPQLQGKKQGIAVIPLRGDIDRYATNLMIDMLTQTEHQPRELDIGSLAQARIAMRDTPSGAEAILYGEVRDLSKTFDSEDLTNQYYNVMVEAQVRIQNVSDGTILWSDTVMEEVKIAEKKPDMLNRIVGWFSVNPTVIIVLVAAVGGLIAFRMLVTGASRPR